MPPCALRPPFVFILLALLTSSLSTGAAVISTCDEAGLRAALGTGEPVTFGCDGTIVLSNSIVINNAATLDADGHTVGLSGGGRTRIFEVSNGGSLHLMGLKLSDGFTLGAAGQEGSGGAIRVIQGELHAASCQFMNNTAAGGLAATNRPGGRARGGAIFVSQGVLRLTNCLFLLNKVRGGQGGDSLTGTVTGGDAGGAACATQDSDVSVIAGQIGGNEAFSGAAGRSLTATYASGRASGGGWQQVGGFTSFMDTSFKTNTAFSAAGGYNLGSGQAYGAGLSVESGTTTVERVVFHRNLVRSGAASNRGSAGTAGGALFNAGTASLSLCRLEDNAAIPGDSDALSGDAAGGAVNNTGTLVLRDCVVERNTAMMGKAARDTILGRHGDSRGGGVWNSGYLSIVNSTFHSNRAFGMRPPAADPFFISGRPAYGGAIHNSGILSVINSTLTGNAAYGGDDYKFSHPFDYGNPLNPSSGGHAFGGAIHQAGGATRLTNVTTAFNQAIGGRSEIPGGRFGENFSIVETSTFFSINSIVAGSGAGSNCVGVIIDYGHNISSDSSCHFSASGSLNDTDPKLGPLAEYGGPTPTMALLEGSPALDTADATACPTVDQRGRTRPFGEGCDIGAFESSPPYTIVGYISGWVDPSADIHVQVDDASLPLGSENNYILADLAPGSYEITPTSPTAVFIQSNAVVTLGPDRLVNFHSYRSNAVTLEMNVAPGTNRVVVAGEAGRAYRLLGTSDLPAWIPVKTNVMPASGIFDYFEAVLPAGNRLFKFESP
ncbi:MAG TPA: choice-of-anchor Q domain-containing protein [Verrucomicrobiae bacterium]|nr:choice-of-anchor Q domain-containing protein [Verrucomicrobiae bacterium]